MCRHPQQPVHPPGPPGTPGTEIGGVTETPSLEAILQDRETRWHQRVSLVTQHALPVGTLTLNIPGMDKNPPGVDVALRTLGRRWRNLIHHAGLSVVHEEQHCGADGPALHLVVRGPARRLKQCAVGVEAWGALGRLADADVLTAHGTPVGRNDLGLPPRTCLLCEAPAMVCIREQRHDLQTVADRVYAILGIHARIHA